MFVFQIIITLIISYITVQYLKLQKNIKKSHGWPGTTQFLDQSNLLVVAGLVPNWLCPWNRTSGWAFKWANFYKKYNVDILVGISPQFVTYHLADADLIKEVSTKRKEFFQKPTFFYGVLAIFGQNVVTTEDEVWKRHRKIVTYGFTEKNNKLVHQESVKFTLDMVKEMKTTFKTKGKAVADVVKYTLKLALCVISSAAFGMKTEWDHGQVADEGCKMSFFAALEEISSRPVEVVLFPRWALNLPILNLPCLGIAIDDFKTYMNRAIAKGKESVEQGAEKDEKHGDLFSTLVKVAFQEKEGAKLSLSDEELMGNLYVLMVAGHETTAHTLSFALGSLALYPDIQTKIYQELESMFPDRDAPSYDELSSLKYTTAVIWETLRMFPIVTEIPKWAPEETTLDDGKIPIPAGSIVNFHVTGLHYNEKHWGPDATTFKPERFLEDYNKDAFIPFSDGPRACLGKRFAQIEATTILAVLVKHFEISVANEADRQNLLEAKIALTLVPKNPVELLFTPRKK